MGIHEGEAVKHQKKNGFIRENLRDSIASVTGASINSCSSMSFNVFRERVQVHDTGGKRKKNSRIGK